MPLVSPSVHLRGVLSRAAAGFRVFRPYSITSGHACDLMRALQTSQEWQQTF